MLYKIAHLVRDYMSWAWNIMEQVNAFIFSMRYGRKLKSLQVPEIVEGYKFKSIKDVDTDKIVQFFEQQPQEAFRYFRPHDFDKKSIKKLQRNRSFLAYMLIDSANGNIAGYCFNRSFFNGNGFRGRMVDISYRGKGLGTLMNKILNEIGFGIGLRLYETVNENNIASYKSALSASKVKVVKELADGDVLYEILKD